MVVVVPAPLVATEATDMTLVEFLLARITEDEASIRADLVGREWPNPRRSRAECEAKRRIVTEAERAIENYEEVAWAYTEGRRDHAIDDLRHLAAVYADYPDYQPEWKP